MLSSLLHHANDLVFGAADAHVHDAAHAAGAVGAFDANHAWAMGKKKTSFSQAYFDVTIIREHWGTFLVHFVKKLHWCCIP